MRERLHVTGRLRSGAADGIAFADGRLLVGESMATPVIRQLKAWRPPREGVTIVDAPPGTACAAMEAVRGADLALLVTEPTPFGHHDLEQAVLVIRDELGIPVRVVLNRDGIGDDGVERYCESEGIPLVLRIPFDRRIAVAYSEGTPLVAARPEYREVFRGLLETLLPEVPA
jgi:MinD superfamily P-loop ATPase